MRKHIGLRAKAAVASGAVLLAGLGVATTAAPAQAAVTDCTPGALCAWVKTSFTDDPGEVYGNNTNLRVYVKFNTAGSVLNRGKECDVLIYPQLSYKGGGYLLKRGKGIPNLNTFSDGRFKAGIGSNKWVC